MSQVIPPTFHLYVPPQQKGWPCLTNIMQRQTNQLCINVQWVSSNVYQLFCSLLTNLPHQFSILNTSCHISNWRNGLRNGSMRHVLSSKSLLRAVGIILQAQQWLKNKCVLAVLIFGVFSILYSGVDNLTHLELISGSSSRRFVQHIGWLWYGYSHRWTWRVSEHADYLH